MRYREIEQKFRLKNPSRQRGLLRRLKARKICAGQEYNEFFDLGNSLRKQKCILRLRKFGGKAVLTLKGRKVQKEFTQRLEIETPVLFSEARALLGMLGFRRVFLYTKRREEYRLGGSVVTLDYLSGFGWFLEIEGTPATIRKIAARLGLTRADQEGRSYLEMLAGDRKRWRAL